MMRRVLRILGKGLSAMLFCVAAGSCSDGGDGLEAQDGGSGGMVVTFTLAMSDPATRAGTGWDSYDPNDPGNEYENRINPEDVQVLVFDAGNNAVIGELEGISVYTNADDELMVEGYIPLAEEASEGDAVNAKVMVFANCGGVKKDTELGDLGYSAAEQPEYMPMWGVASTQLVLGKGQRVDLEDIWLLRAMAKVEVKLADGMAEKGYSLQGVTLDRRNTSGYCLPGNYGSVADTRDLKFAETLRVPIEPGLVVGQTDFTGGVIYVPEYVNTGDATRATITVTVGEEGNEDKEYTLQFADYGTDGALVADSYHDIVRNHWYVYTLYKDNGEMKIRLSVRPWATYEHPEITM